jgi:hypothetical protein
MYKHAFANVARRTHRQSRKPLRKPPNIRECIDRFRKKLLPQSRHTILIPLRSRLQLGIRAGMKPHPHSAPRFFNDSRMRCTDSRQSTSFASPRSTSSARRSISASHSLLTSPSGPPLSKLKISCRASSARSPDGRLKARLTKSVCKVISINDYNIPQRRQTINCRLMIFVTPSPEFSQLASRMQSGYPRNACQEC